MNIVNKLLNACADFALLNIVLAAPAAFNIVDAAWYGLCIVLGFVLRIGILVKDDKYTHKLLLIHAVFTICWCFLAVMAWKTWFYLTWLNSGKGFEIYLFFNSLSAVFMVGEFDYFSKKGYRNWMRSIAGKILAKEEGRKDI